jgi:transposase
MGRAYSTDLRQKIIDTHNQQESSQRQLAKRFRVSLTFRENLLKRYRTDGTVEPRAHGGGRLAKLSPEQEAVLATLVAEDNDAILVELCERLEQRVGVRISRATMGRIVQKLKLTRKKNSACDPARHGTSAIVASAVLARNWRSEIREFGVCR